MAMCTAFVFAQKLDDDVAEVLKAAEEKAEAKRLKKVPPL